MYICTECQEKFDTKPEYCSCGNDEFKFIREDVNSQSMENSQEIPPTQKQEDNLSKNNFPLKDLPIKSIFSISFFVICIILSILIWLLKPEHKPSPPIAPQETRKEIPDFEKIWKEDFIKVPVKKTQEKQSVTGANGVNGATRVNAANQIKGPTEEPQNKPQSIHKQKEQTTTQQHAKPTQTQNSSIAKHQPANPMLTQNSPITKPQPSQPEKQQANSESPSKIKLPQSVTDTIKQTFTSQTQEFKPAPIPEIHPPKPKPEPQKMNESDFLNYKGAVRSALLVKLNVTAIQGSGDCAIEFSVDNSGKLINRNFIYKSTNKTVNDEVYNMLMRLPYYKQPPTHYNGEKIKLKFMFNNGYYEISFL